MNDYLRLAWGAYIMLAVAVIGATATQHGWTSSETATWAQGFGTVAAVFVAIWAASLPAQNEAQSKRRRRDAFLDLLRDSVNYASQRVEHYHKSYNIGLLAGVKGAMAIYNRSHALDGLTRLIEMDLAEWPSHALYVRTKRLIHHHKSYRQLVDEVVSGDEELEGLLPYTQRSHAKVRDELLAAIEQARS